MKNDRNRNVFYSVFGLLAALLVIALLVLLFVFPAKTYSAKERRMLAGFPEFSLSTVLSGEFMEGIEDFAKDQFFGRDEIFGVRGEANRLLENRESNGVYLLKNGALAERFVMPEEETFEDLMEELRQFSEKTKGMNQYFLLAPTAISFAEGELPVFADQESEGQYIDRFGNALPERMTFVDVRDAFRKASSGTELYYKTDHHWTTDGARIAAAALLSEMGLRMDFTEEKGVVSKDFVGTLAAKSGFPVETADAVTVYKLAAEPEEDYYYSVYYEDEQRVSASFYEASALSGDDPYEVFFGGNHSRIDIRTSAGSGRRLLIIKDSYANALIPFLVRSFDRITVVDPRYYDGDLDLLLEEERFTDVVFLYNACTLSEDTSLPIVLQNEQ